MPGVAERFQWHFVTHLISRKRLLSFTTKGLNQKEQLSRTIRTEHSCITPVRLPHHDDLASQTRADNQHGIIQTSCVEHSLEVGHATVSFDGVTIADTSQIPDAPQAEMSECIGPAMRDTVYERNHTAAQAIGRRQECEAPSPSCSLALLPAIDQLELLSTPAVSRPPLSSSPAAMDVFAATGAFILASLTSISGHGYIMDLAAVWKLGYPNNGYISEVKNRLWGDVDYSVFGYGPEGQLKYFAKNFPESSGTMRDLIMENQKVWTEGVDPVCGDTLLDEAKRTTMPASGKISFSGFTHPGPCELWCDDNKLAFANGCATEYPDNKVPFDATKCAGANRFTLYWIAVHGTPWQVYTNCVYLKGGSAGSALDGTIASNATTMAPKATTATPKATTAAPETTTAPSADTTSGSTPSPTKKKCTAKTRRA